MTIKCSALRTLNGQLRHQSNWGCNKHRLPLDRRTNNSLPPPLGRGYYAKGKLKKSTAGQQKKQKQGRANEGFQQFDRWSSDGVEEGLQPYKNIVHLAHGAFKLSAPARRQHAKSCHRMQDER